MGVNAIIETGCKPTHKFIFLQYPKRVIFVFNIKEPEKTIAVTMNDYRTIGYNSIFLSFLFAAVLFFF
jgi:hypothetical protein